MLTTSPQQKGFYIFQRLFNTLARFLSNIKLFLILNVEEQQSLFESFVTGMNIAKKFEICFLNC